MKKKQKKTRILAIDPAQFNIGYAYRDEVGNIIHGIAHQPKKKGNDYCQNLETINNFFDELMENQPFTHAVVEATIFPSQKSSKLAQYAGWGKLKVDEVRGVLKRLFAHHNLPYLDIYPTSLKAFIAGHGHSPKTWVMEGVNRLTDIYFTDDNEADAVGLLLIAEAYLAICNVEGLEYGKVALSRIKPELTAYFENMGVKFLSKEEFRDRKAGR